MRRSRRWSGSPFWLNHSEKAMSYSILRTVLLVLLVLLGACREAEVAEEPEEVASNEALRQLFETDQQDREPDWASLPPDSLMAFMQRDAEHLLQVKALRDAGEVRTAEDHYHAAMIFHHAPGDDTTHFQRAYELARDAYRLDSTFVRAIKLMAQAHDRYLQATGQRQIYGTQIDYRDGVYALMPIDTTQVTDDERRRIGLRTVPEMRAIVACLQAGGTIETCTQ